MKPANAIDCYLYLMRESAAWWTARATAEARHFMRTGEHQRIGEWVGEKDDGAVTRRRLARYQEWLAAARVAGRYRGGTRLMRVLPDGSRVAWGPPASLEQQGVAGRVARVLASGWRRLAGT